MMLKAVFILVLLGVCVAENPPFNVTAQHSAADKIQVIVGVDTGKTSIIGFFNSATSTDKPNYIISCEPSKDCVAQKLEFDSSNSNKGKCTAKTAGTDYTVTNNNTVVFPKTVLPSAEQHSTTLYWAQQNVATFDCPALLATSFKTKPSFSILPITTQPTFNITITRPADTTLETAIVPGNNKTAFFGWRNTEGALYPTDALICAPSVSSIDKCLDASCTSISACTARTTTIYTQNTSKDGTAKLTRTLTAGDVKLSTSEKMYLAWDSMDTPSSTTSLDVADLKDRTTWKYYSMSVPAKSSAQTIVPSIMAVALVLLYVIA